MEHIKSYIEGNLDFLAECSRENKWDTILTTFDVVGLCSNIRHEYGLNFPESLHPNYLNFDNEYFNQIKGTAMGTIFVPT